MTRGEMEQLPTQFADHEAQQMVSNNADNVFVQSNLTRGTAAWTH